MSAHDDLLRPIVAGTSRVLVIDIESSPNLAHVWSLWGQNVSLSQLRETGRVICFAAKWYGERKVAFHSDHHDGHDQMIATAHRLIDEADIVVTYNGVKYDMPHLAREFVIAGLNPPRPYKDVDLLRAVKRRFRFTSHKLDHVAGQLGIGGKVAHTGHDLWVRCMDGDDKAWNLMRRYNIGDVRLTEKLYDRIRPWIDQHPHMNPVDGLVCNRCGSTDLERDGDYRAVVIDYGLYVCKSCGAHVRAGHQRRVAGTRGVR